MLQALDVRRSYDAVVALAGASLRVEAGECVALVGESGSGKTTLLRMFNRLVESDAGRVLVGGEDVAHADPVRLRRRIGYVPQEGGLLPHWRVLRNVALVPRLAGRPDAEVRASRALELVGLRPDALGGRWPSELSGGQRQRVAIARALADQPGYLLLDEPFGALDAITRAEVQQAFRSVRERLGVTTLLVTHDLAEARRLADRIAVMRSGRVEQVGRPDELRDRPATPYVAELVERSGAWSA
jgi:osmoprotectant transport system ATP-binding protein